MEASSDNRTISLVQPDRPPVTLIGGNTQTVVSSSNNNPLLFHNKPPDSTEVTTPQPTTHGQLQDFNHAISYVNRIKSRFDGRPEVYKQFLDILHRYQRDYSNSLNEEQVYAEVQKLFAGQHDLLEEFSRFLPECSVVPLSRSSTLHGHQDGQSAVHSAATLPAASGSLRSLQLAGARCSSASKRPRESDVSAPISGVAKKPRSATTPRVIKDVSVPAISKVGSLKDFAFFDKVRQSMGHSEVYDHFLRCIYLFNKDLITRQELVDVTSSFLQPFPQLQKTFCESLIGDSLPNAGGEVKREVIVETTPTTSSDQQHHQQGRNLTRTYLDIDFSTCKRYGNSYRYLPAGFRLPKCTGRDSLCMEVLNDNLVSFPSWSSEDTQFVSSKKSQFEEVCYRVEDERFELDMVLELNTLAIAHLETIQRRISRMNPEEQTKFRLNDDLGASSGILQKKAIHRIYGEKAVNIILGLQENPVVAVPLVLRRLKAKAEEWREAQKAFNKIWREQNEKNYLKSLDHQSNNFKQTDIRMLRSRALINEITSREEGAKSLKLNYPMSEEVCNDAANLLIHHIKRQTYYKEEKSRMKTFVRVWLQDLFAGERMALSEDEADWNVSSDSELDGKREDTVKHLLRKQQLPDLCSYSEMYRLVYANNSLYVFIRLHHTLCQRLQHMKSVCDSLVKLDENEKNLRSESTAVALRLRQPYTITPDKYYSHFLELVRGFLDGHTDSGAFEDQIRELFGVQHYACFTLDKVVSFTVKQLHNLVTDEASQKLTRLFTKELLRGGCGGLLKSRAERESQEESYRRKAVLLFPDSQQQSEYLFRINLFQPTALLTIDYLGITTKPGVPGTTYSNNQDFRTSPYASCSSPIPQICRWSHYLDRYVNSSNSESFTKSDVSKSCSRQIFMVRNILHWIRRVSDLRDVNEVAATDEFSSGATAADEAEFCQGIREKQWQRDTRRLLRSTFNFVATPEELYRDVVYWDNTEIVGASEQCKLLYATGCESLFYRAGKLSVAKKKHQAVSERMTGRWTRWLASKNVVDENSVCSDWLVGRDVPSQSHTVTTQLETVCDLNKPPYRRYNKYTCRVNTSPATEVEKNEPINKDPQHQQTASSVSNDALAQSTETIATTSQ